VLALEIAEELEAALEQFAAIGGRFEVVTHWSQLITFRTFGQLLFQGRQAKFPELVTLESCPGSH
jgi:hypothetical protein